MWMASWLCGWIVGYIFLATQLKDIEVTMPQNIMVPAPYIYTIYNTGALSIFFSESDSSVFTSVCHVETCSHTQRGSYVFVVKNHLKLAR